MNENDFDKREIIIIPAENGIIMKYLVDVDDDYMYKTRIYKRDIPKDLEFLIYDIFEYLELLDYAIKIKIIKNEEEN